MDDPCSELTKFVQENLEKGVNDLCSAVSNNDDEKFEEEIKKDNPKYFRNAYGLSPAMVAAATGNVDMLKEMSNNDYDMGFINIFEKGLPPFVPCKECSSETPCEKCQLHYSKRKKAYDDRVAAKEGKFSTIFNEWKPIMLAQYGGYDKAVELLRKSRYFDTEIPIQYSRIKWIPTFHSMIENNDYRRVKVVWELIEKEIYKPTYGSLWNELEYAFNSIMHQSTETFMFFYQKLSDDDKEDLKNMCVDACNTGKVKLEYLISLGIGITKISYIEYLHKMIYDEIDKENNDFWDYLDEFLCRKSFKTVLHYNGTKDKTTPHNPYFPYYELKNDGSGDEWYNLCVGLNPSIYCAQKFLTKVKVSNIINFLRNFEGDFFANIVPYVVSGSAWDYFVNYDLDPEYVIFKRGKKFYYGYKFDTENKSEPKILKIYRDLEHFIKGMLKSLRNTVCYDSTTDIFEGKMIIHGKDITDKMSKRYFPG